MLSHYWSYEAFNQVSALPDIIFANAVLCLQVVHLTLADLFCRWKKRGSTWGEKIMRDRRRRHTRNRPPNPDFSSCDSSHAAHWEDPRLRISHLWLSAMFLGSAKSPSSGLLFYLEWKPRSSDCSTIHSSSYELRLWEHCSFEYNNPSHWTTLNYKTSETCRNRFWIEVEIYFRHMIMPYA